MTKVPRSFCASANSATFLRTAGLEPAQPCGHEVCEPGITTAFMGKEAFKYQRKFTHLPARFPEKGSPQAKRVGYGRPRSGGR